MSHSPATQSDGNRGQWGSYGFGPELGPRSGAILTSGTSLVRRPKRELYARMPRYCSGRRLRECCPRPFWIVATPVFHWLLPSHAPKCSAACHVTFTGTDAANVANETGSSALRFGGTSECLRHIQRNGFQFTLGECAAAGTGTATATATRNLRASVVTAGASTLSGTAIRGAMSSPGQPPLGGRHSPRHPATIAAARWRGVSVRFTR